MVWVFGSVEFAYGRSRYRNFSLWLESDSESQIKTLGLGTEKTLSKQISLPRVKQKALGTEKTLAKDFFTKNFFAKCNFLTLGKESLKNHFFASNFFLSSTYTYTKFMLKFGTISALFAIFKIFAPF
jgi:hypothetical protein